MNLADLALRHARLQPEHLAVVFGDREISYAEFAELAGRAAAGLSARGVGRGDRVLFYSRNRVEYLTTYAACAWIGAIFAPVHHEFKMAELGYVSENALATIAFVDERFVGEYADFQRAFPALPADVVVLSDNGVTTAADGLRLVGNDDFLGAVEDIPAVADLAAETPVLICYTSGSTAKPKPVLRSHGSETWNAETYFEYWDFAPDDRMLLALPLSWVYGLSTLAQAMLAVGATIELLSHFNPVVALQAVTTNHATLFAGTNTMYVKLLDVYDRQGGDLASLRHCYIGGEPSNDAVVERFEGIIQSRLWQGYAATEVAPVILTDPRYDAAAPRHTVGRLVPGAEIELRGPEGRPVDPGEPGEAFFRSPGSMLGYYREPQLTRERVTDDGWFSTGDLVVERDGYYFVVGRKIDMIIRGGSNIAPAEVESALTRIPGVVDAVVFGLPDPEYGEKVAAAISTSGHGQVSDEELTAALGDLLAAFKRPSVYFRNLDLPDGTNAKRNRKAVREIALTSTR